MGELRASAGCVDLAPSPGQWMSGYGARIHPATGTHDPITARAILLDDGSSRVVLVTCDIIGLDYAVVQEIRSRISDGCGIPAGNIVVATTHTHSGPAAQAYRGVLGTVDMDWLESLKTKVVDLVCSLPVKLQSATFAYTRADMPGIGRNRQDPTRGIDEEGFIVGIDALDGTAIATILNFGCHAVVLGGDNLHYSSDWPGAARRRIESKRGGTAVFVAGTIGDVNPALGHGEFDLVEKVGFAAADLALPVLSSAKSAREVELGVASGIMDCLLEAPPSPVDIGRFEAEYTAQKESSAAAGDRVAELIAGAMLDWVAGLRSVLAKGPAPTSTPAEITLVSINDFVLVTAPFELYSDLGIAIKQSVGPGKTAYVGCANGLLGYMTAEWAKDQGGYGPGEAYKWFLGMVTAIDRTAGALLVKTASDLARKLSA